MFSISETLYIIRSNGRHRGWLLEQRCLEQKSELFRHLNKVITLPSELLSRVFDFRFFISAYPWLFYPPIQQLLEYIPPLKKRWTGDRFECLLLWYHRSIQTQWWNYNRNGILFSPGIHKKTAPSRPRMVGKSAVIIKYGQEMNTGTRQFRLIMDLISEIRIYFLSRRVKSLKIYFE